MNVNKIEPIFKNTETIRLLGGPEHFLGENVEVNPGVDILLVPYIQNGTLEFVQSGEMVFDYKPDLFSMIRFKRVSNTNIFYAKEELS